MTPTLFSYPESASFGHQIPKSKIYDHATPGKSVKQLFVSQVEQIVWAYKLAPATINLPASPGVPEIQILSICLKNGECDHEVLRCIDQAIPYPLFFELSWDTQVKGVAAYKHMIDGVAANYEIGDYFETPWLSQNVQRSPLPVVLNLGVLYERLLAPVLPLPARPGERLPETVVRLQQIRSKQKELAQCQKRLTREKQFNRKVVINATLRTLKQELASLTKIS